MCIRSKVVTSTVLAEDSSCNDGASTRPYKLKLEFESFNCQQNIRGYKLVTMTDICQKNKKRKQISPQGSSIDSVKARPLAGDVWCKWMLGCSQEHKLQR